MVVKIYFVIALVFVLIQCGSSQMTDRESLMGKWEGRNTEGKTAAYLIIQKDSIYIEFVSEPISSSTHSYRLIETDRQLRIKIEGIEETLLVVINEQGQMTFDLDDVDRQKVHVPLLSTLRYVKLATDE